MVFAGMFLSVLPKLVKVKKLSNVVKEVLLEEVWMTLFFLEICIRTCLLVSPC